MEQVLLLVQDVDKECIVVPIGEDEEGSKKRLNIGQVITTKVKPHRKGYKYRTKIDRSGENVVVGCFAIEEDEEVED